jgi:hypothetical protein
MLRLDRYGIAHPLPGASVDAYVFERGADGALGFALPAPADLDLPATLREPLARLVADWTAGAATPEEKVTALTQHLERDYIYSQRFDRQRGVDPVLDFLQRSHRGHCQYFASALTLLARSAGVPARLVSGFRLEGRDVRFGYTPVRAWSAHAWVEVALPQGWTTFDPAPLLSDESGASPRASWLARLREALAYGSGALVAAVFAWRGLLAGVALLVVLAVAWRRRATRRGTPIAIDPTRVDPPLTSGRQLFALLAHHGVTRAGGETLEAFASRLPQARLPRELADALPDLVRRYAALRYGSHGDPADLARDVADFVGRFTPG